MHPVPVNGPITPSDFPPKDRSLDTELPAVTADWHKVVVTEYVPSAVPLYEKFCSRSIDKVFILEFVPCAFPTKGAPAKNEMSGAVPSAE